METKRTANCLVIRLDPGEELINSLLTACQEHDIHCAQITGIGAAKKITCGVFDPKTREYHSEKFKGIFEITSLNGTITTMDGGLYPHIHVTFADEKYKVRGGQQVCDQCHSRNRAHDPGSGDRPSGKSGGRAEPVPVLSPAGWSGHLQAENADRKSLRRWEKPQFLNHCGFL